MVYEGNICNFHRLWRARLVFLPSFTSILYTFKNPLLHFTLLGPFLVWSGGHTVHTTLISVFFCQNSVNTCRLNTHRCRCLRNCIAGASFYHGFYSSNVLRKEKEKKIFRQPTRGWSSTLDWAVKHSRPPCFPILWFFSIKGRHTGYNYCGSVLPSYVLPGFRIGPLCPQLTRYGGWAKRLSHVVTMRLSVPHSSHSYKHVFRTATFFPNFTPYNLSLVLYVLYSVGALWNA